MNALENPAQRPVQEASPWYRWMILICVSCAMFGNYYIYDSISPIANLLKSQLNFTDQNIGLLNAIYSIPNVIMVLIGGLIIDVIGTRRATLLFSLFCMIGASVTAVKGNIVIMAAGRLIFGLGAESLIVAITTVIAKWFKGKELSFAFGLNLTIAHLGSFAALHSPTLAKSWFTSWQKPLFIPVIVGIISVIAVIIYFSLETQSLKRYSLALSEKVDRVGLKDLVAAFSRLKSSFWLITFLGVTFYSAVFPFQIFAVKFFMKQHGLTRDMAGFTSSFITLAAMIGTPLFGLLIDFIGKRASLMIFGSILIITGYLLLLCTAIPPIIPIIFLGIAFSLIPVALWPSVAFIVEEKYLGTAYGLMTMIQNIGLAGFNLLIGYVNDTTDTYTTGMWIFSILGFFSLLFTLLLKRFDRISMGGRLEYSTISSKK